MSNLSGLSYSSSSLSSGTLCSTTNTFFLNSSDLSRLALSLTLEKIIITPYLLQIAIRFE
ncbi:MAG: hypothetical protein CL899_02525 [Dehalococcoidia bacterium]|nr:hypothetical protein [Dehalococcoidia bacterium]